MHSISRKRMRSRNRKTRNLGKLPTAETLDSILGRLSCIVLLLPHVGGEKLSPSLGEAGHGRLPERPKGADCKSAGNAFTGSNPVSATNGKARNHAQWFRAFLVSGPFSRRGGS